MKRSIAGWKTTSSLYLKGNAGEYNTNEYPRGQNILETLHTEFSLKKYKLRRTFLTKTNE